MDGEGVLRSFMPPTPSNRYAFGPFLFDAATGFLTRNGKRLRIPDQAARVLTVLLGHPGELVTREEMRQALWPEGEFVDFEHSINNAVSQLRSVLRDDPKAPRFIETVPKRGYRFKCSVCDSFAGAQSDEEQDPCRVVTPGSIAADPPPGMPCQAAPKDPLRFQRWNKGKWAWVIVAFLCVLVFIFVVYARHRSHGKKIILGIPPFEAVGPGSGALSDSLRLDLTESLDQLPGVQVLAAKSFAERKLSDEDLRALAKSLNLNVLLLGKFSILSDSIQVDLELVSSSNVSHRTSFHYHGTLSDLPVIRDRIQRDLFLRLNPVSRGQIRSHTSTSDPRAYELYLRARYAYSLRTQESLNSALMGFHAAAGVDPLFPDAYAWMAATHLALANVDTDAYRAHLGKAKELAEQALKLDDSLPLAYATLGYIAFREEWDLPKAEWELRRAVDLQPGEALNHILLSSLLCSQGRFEEARLQVDLARAIEPLCPSTLVAAVHVAVSARQWNRAREMAEQLVTMAPNLPLAHNSRAWVYWYTGKYLDAIKDWRSEAVLRKDDWRVQKEDQGLEAYLRGGVQAYAKVRLGCIQFAERSRRHSNDFIAAEWHLYAGDPEASLDAMDTMVKDHVPAVLDLTTNPSFSGFHKNTRFRALADRLGLKVPSSYPRG